MTTSFMLRVASALSALFTVGHSLGGLKHWSPFPDNPVMAMMAATRFRVSGVTRSYLDLYVGLGWTITVFMVLQTVLLWQMASLARTNLPQARAMILPFVLASLVNAVIAWRLIFMVPALFSVALLMVLLVAWFAERPGRLATARASAS